MLDRSFLPRDAAGLVGEYNAAEAGTIGQQGLERIVAYTAGNWADHAKSGCGIVVVRGQDNCRSSAALSVADRAVKIDPDEVTGLRTIVTRLRCQRAAPNQSLHDGCPVLCRQPAHRVYSDACAAATARSRSPACRCSRSFPRPCRRWHRFHGRMLSALAARGCCPTSEMPLSCSASKFDLQCRYGLRSRRSIDAAGTLRFGMVTDGLRKPAWRATVAFDRTNASLAGWP